MACSSLREAQCLACCRGTEASQDVRGSWFLLSEIPDPSPSPVTTLGDMVMSEAETQ